MKIEMPEYKNLIDLTLWTDDLLNCILAIRNRYISLEQFKTKTGIIITRLQFEKIGFAINQKYSNGFYFVGCFADFDVYIKSGLEYIGELK